MGLSTTAFDDNSIALCVGTERHRAQRACQ